MIFVVVVVKKNCFRVVNFSVGLLKKVIFWFGETTRNWCLSSVCYKQTFCLLLLLLLLLLQLCTPTSTYFKERGKGLLLQKRKERVKERGKEDHK